MMSLPGSRIRRTVATAAIAAGLFMLGGFAGAQDATGYQGPDRQQRLLEGAKKEGELQLYTSTPADEIAVLITAFEKKYGIKVKLWRSGSDMVVQRLIGEGHAHRFEADVIEADGTNLEALYREQLLQEVRSPYLADLIPQAIPPHRQWVAARVNIFTLAYNTRLVAKSDLPKSWADLLDPKWKGKLGIEAADADWFATIIGELGEAKGLKLFRDIVATNGVSVRKGHTLLANLVASGEVPLGLTVHNFKAEQFKRNGAPIDWFIIPPAVAQLNGIAVSRNPPHPNAAVLFYDFMLTDGQAVLAQHDYMTTNKKFPTPLSKLPLKFMDHKTVLDETDKWNKLYQDIIVKQMK